MLPIIVQKYGGSSVADIDRIQRVAQHVVETAQQGYNLVVVVSAMGKTTDVLMQMAKELDPEPPHRELDMLLSVGERISMSLLSIAINKAGREAISFTGSQVGIVTNDSHSNARIIEVRPFRIQDELEKGRVVIVAGYQGTSYKREITTLGRGGSDTTAIALAAALEAERVEIYSDVEGVFSADPKVVPDAYKLDEIGMDEMMMLSKTGAKVMAADALEYASRHNIAIFTRKTGAPHLGGTVIRRNAKTDDRRFTAVTGKKDVVCVQFIDGSGRGGEELFECLNAVGAQDIMPFMSHVSLSDHMGASFLFALENFHQRGRFEEEIRSRFGDDVSIRTDIGTVTLVGPGIAEDPATHQRITAFLKEHQGLIHQVFFLPLAVSMLVSVSDVDHLVRDIHDLFLHRPVSGGTAAA